MGGKGRWIFIWLILLLPGCISIQLLPGWGKLRETTLAGKGDAKILLIDISGMLDTKKESGLIEKPSLPARVKEELTKAEEDKNIKALILRINSPGGTVTASDILYHEILSFKKKQKIPVVASIMDIGTSGGFYVAMAADRVIGHPSTVTGSIGVIMVTANAEGLMEKIGIQPTTIASGPKKSMGSPFRAMQPDEREIFQEIIDSLYGRFLEVVRTGRPDLPQDNIRALADGRIFTAQTALQAGLIDQIGYLDDAVSWAKEEANLETARVVTYRSGRGGHANIYSQDDTPTVGAWSFPLMDSGSWLQMFGGGPPQLMYLWMPSR